MTGFWGCDHKFTKWSKPYNGNTTQQRKCRKCNRVKVRKVRPCFLGTHRWKMDRRHKPPIFRCKKCPATKPTKKAR